MEKYDLSQHYHIGYYEDGHDLEVTAYKRINEPVWDAYIPHYEAGNFYPALMGSKTPTSKFSGSKEVRWGINCP
ncbi:DUF3986 family protein [Bacillus luti]|uniref:DUF3986 family protein n=1 Tax=Bacillus luti TaxID=2026191 RepID=A0A7V7V5A8_9BACI|nr:DUF3986 family protein [Bacillus luti]